MKCPNCSSHMFIAAETTNSLSHVTFYRCSVCISEHVSSEPIVEHANHDSTEYFDGPSAGNKGYMMI